jgi:hypothetical protein
MEIMWLKLSWSAVLRTTVGSSSQVLYVLQNVSGTEASRSHHPQQATQDSAARTAVHNCAGGLESL